MGAFLHTTLVRVTVVCEYVWLRRYVWQRAAVLSTISIPALQRVTYCMYIKIEFLQAAPVI